MRALRGLVAIALFILGFILVAAGVCWVIFSLAGSALARPQPPVGEAVLGVLPGLIAGAVGMGLLFASRAMDSERGPVRRYGKKRKRARV